MRCFAFILILFLPLFSWAQTPENSAAVSIDKIIITDSAASSSQSKSFTQPSTIVSLPQKRARTVTVAEVLSGNTGVHVLRYGGLEQSTAVSIRGSSDNQVQIVLDGVPLETAASEGIGLSDISADGLESISIYKSFSPAELGASAVGGVVDLKSRDIKPGWHQHYALGLGSYFTTTAHADVQHGGEVNSFELGMDFRRTDGDFSFLDDNGTPLNVTDDQVVTRQNNHSQILHPHFKWRHQLSGDAQIEWVNHVFRIDSGVPGLGNSQSVTANRSLTEVLGAVSWERSDYCDAKFSLKNQAFYRVIKMQFSDPNGEIGLGSAQDTDDDTLILGDRFTAKYFATDWFKIQTMAEYTFENYRPQDFAAATVNGSTSNRHTLTLVGEPQFSFLNNRLQLTPQIRSITAVYDVNDDDPSLFGSGTFFSQRTENQMAAQLNAVYAIKPFLSVKGDVGRSVRLPKFSEMFGDQGFVLGNPRLSSEKSLAFSLGAEWHLALGKIFPKVEIETNYFERHVDDLIQFELNGSFARASNIGNARIRGVESLLKIALPKYFKFIEAYTFQQAVDLAINRGNFLVGRPEHEFNSTISFATGSWTANLRANLVDNQYLDALNTRKVNARLLVEADASYVLNERYRFTVELKNLTDSQVVDAVGFPLPGRSYFGRVDIYF